MEIEEIKCKKQALEGILIELFNKFETDTSMVIRSIYFDRIKIIGKENGPIVVMDLDVVL